MSEPATPASGIPPLRRGEWDGSGGTRELMGRVLGQRLDEVLVSTLDANMFAVLRRAGLPVAEVDATTARGIPSTEKTDGLAGVDGEPSPHAAAFRWRFRALPYLSYSVSPVSEHIFEVSDADVAAYGMQSGDMNPLHFDDEFARRAGFESHIAHGMLFNSWLTRFLGMEFPGPGTIFRSNSSLYLAPIYPGRRYTVRVSTPVADNARGTMTVVAQLLDAAGMHCVVAYNDVVFRGPPR